MSFAAAQSFPIIQQARNFTCSTPANREAEPTLDFGGAIKSFELTGNPLRGRLKPLLITGALIIGAAFFLAAIHVLPFGFIGAAVITGIVALAILVTCKNAQKFSHPLEIEAKSLSSHIFNKKPYYDVLTVRNAHDKDVNLLIGQAPLRHGRCNFQDMQEKEKIKGVFSIQEEGVETIDHPFFHPMTERDYQNYTDRDGESIEILYKNLGEIPDHKLLSCQEIEDGVAELEKMVNNGSIENGQGVLIHCFSGKGRSATILAAFLAKHYADKVRADLKSLEKCPDLHTKSAKWEAKIHEIEQEMGEDLDQNVKNAAKLIYLTRPGTTVINKIKRINEHAYCNEAWEEFSSIPIQQRSTRLDELYLQRNLRVKDRLLRFVLARDNLAEEVNPRYRITSFKEMLSGLPEELR